MAILTIAILAVLGIIGGATATNPNLWNNVLALIDPDIAELEESRQETYKIIGIMLILVVLIVGIFALWQYSKQQKDQKAKDRRDNRMNRLLNVRRLAGARNVW